MKLSTRLRRLIALLPMLWYTNGVQAKEGIPALLQFAEQYSMGEDHPRDSTPVETKTARPAQIQVPSSDLRHGLKDRDAQLVKQQAMLRRQERELVTLRQSLATQNIRIEQMLKAAQEQLKSKQKPADWTTLQKLFKGLRQAAFGQPDEQRIITLIAAAQDATENERAVAQKAHEQVNALKRQLQKGNTKKTNDLQEQQVLKQQLDEKTTLLLQQRQLLSTAHMQQAALKAELKTLETNKKHTRTAHAVRQEKENAALTAELSAKENQLIVLEKKAQDLKLVTEQKEATLSATRQENKELQERLLTQNKQRSKAEADLIQQTQALIQVQSDIELLQTRAKWLAKPQMLSKPAGLRAYAAGSALGHDILTMLNERKGWGIETDQQTLLAGVIDAFTGQYQLTTDVLSRALAESETAVTIAREKAIAGQKKKSEAYVAEFKKQKGVKKSPAGFWFRVDYAGNTPLRDTDIVDVVVKETLTDGTVIQDMALSGNVLSQPLNAYPMLFREAIGYLNSHGSLTMVVPPALAYGEDGYPPKIPPNATMVYEIRIDNSKAAPEGKSAKPGDLQGR